MPRLPLHALLLITVLSASCVAGPFERSNMTDPAAGGRIIITDVPDTLFSQFETFDAGVTLTKELPPNTTSVSWEIVSGGQYLVSQGSNRFASTANVGLLPVPAQIAAYFPGRDFIPRATRTVWLRQRPVALALECLSLCGIFAQVDLFGELTLSLRDARGNAVRLPSTDFRFGTVVSRSPDVISIESRPAPNKVAIRSVSRGKAWVVIYGEGLSDSVELEVVPRAVARLPML